MEEGAGDWLAIVVKEERDSCGCWQWWKRWRKEERRREAVREREEFERSDGEEGAAILYLFTQQEQHISNVSQAVRSLRRTPHTAVSAGRDACKQ